MASPSSATNATLAGNAGEQLTLQKIDIEGRLVGLLFKVKARQHYQNQSDETIEAVYTFPLAWGVSLLGMSVTLGDQHLHGVVVEKDHANRNYEKAIQDGDTPVMLEQSGDGLYTAHLGNLKQGEEAVIEIEYAQLLKFDQGSIRLAIPTTVAPRYGDPFATGGLAQPACVNTDAKASYPLSLHIALEGEVAKGTVTCPTHSVSMSVSESGTSITLARGGMLDRDFVLNIDSLQAYSFATCLHDENGYTVLASFCPDFPVAEASPLALKILVDCSGSMEGDSMFQARQGLREVCKLVTPADQLSLSRFGSDIHHTIKTLSSCTPAFIQQILMPAIEASDADMGGTELNKALLQTFRLKGAKESRRNADVLLITDGEVWDIEKTIQSAQQSRHRIFAVGVGSAPAESLLQHLAESTGGACELVTPNEDIVGAIVRMFRRMRAAVASDIAINWHGTPQWASPLPGALYPGETVHAFALFSAKPDQAPTLNWTGINPGQCAASALQATNEAALARLCGARQIKTAATKAEAIALALRYQLVTEDTNLFMVVERSEEEKALGLPRLKQISHMPPASHNTFDTVRFSRSSLFNPLSALSRSTSAQEFFSLEETPVYCRVSTPALTGSLTPSALMKLFDEVALKCLSLEEAAPQLAAANLDTPISNLIALIEENTHSQHQAWTIFLWWLSIYLLDQIALSRHANRLLTAALKNIDADTKTYFVEWLVQSLPDAQAESWGAVDIDDVFNQPDNLTGNLFNI